MEKLKYPKDLYDSFMERTEDSVNKIMKAELKSFRETEVSEHFPKVWIVTSYAVSLCTLKTDSSLQQSLGKAIEELKYAELKDMDPEMRSQVGNKPSELLAILSVFPSKAMDLKKIIKEDKAFAAKVMAKKISIDDLENDEKYGDCVFNTIFAQLDCFYKDTKVNIYRVIVHNNEVLDIYLDEQLAGNGRINGISNFIEVDRKWTE